MTKSREHRPIDRTDLASLVAEGLSIAQIARRLDRNPKTVERWLNRHGMQTKKTPSRDDWGRIKELRESGMSFRQIAAATGCTLGKVEYALYAQKTQPLARVERTRPTARALAMANPFGISHAPSLLFLAKKSIANADESFNDFRGAS